MFTNCSRRILQALLKAYPHQAWVPRELPWVHPLYSLNYPEGILPQFTRALPILHSSVRKRTSVVLGEDGSARHGGEDPWEEKIHREGKQRWEKQRCDGWPCWILFSVSYYIVHLISELIFPP